MPRWTRLWPSTSLPAPPTTSPITGGSGSIYNQALTLNGGTLNKSDGTANTVAFGGTIALGTGGGTITNSGGSGVWTIGSTISGSTALTINGAGSIALTGTNTYTGSTTINGSNQSFTVTVASLANGGSNSSIGASTNAASNLILTNSGVLSYVGTTAATTDRLFQLGNTTAADTGTIANNAATANTLSFTNTGALTYGTTNQTRTLILSGTNTGANSFAPAIGDNGTGAVSLSKTGAGTWALSGGNTFTGATTISAGTLTLDYSTNNTSKLSDTAALTLSGGTLNLSGGTHTEVVGSTTLTAVTASNITRASGSAILGNGSPDARCRCHAQPRHFRHRRHDHSRDCQRRLRFLAHHWRQLARHPGWQQRHHRRHLHRYRHRRSHRGWCDQQRAPHRCRRKRHPWVIGDQCRHSYSDRDRSDNARYDRQDFPSVRPRLGALRHRCECADHWRHRERRRLHRGWHEQHRRGAGFRHARERCVTVNATITDNGAGAVSLTKVGANDLTLAGTNSYSGGTTLSGGALRVSNSSALGTGALTVDTTATLATASGSKTVVLANALTLGSGVTLSVDAGFADLFLTGTIFRSGRL